MGIIAPPVERQPTVRSPARGPLTRSFGDPAVILVGTALSVTAAAATVALIGSDADWLAVLGRFISVHHRIPAGLPFATASEKWSNPLVLAELIFHGFSSLGARGLMLAQVIAVALGFAALGADAVAAGARASGAAAALAVVALGSLPSLAIIRGQLFSLALFPLLVLVLRRDERVPSGRIWLVAPLLALWSNLNGVAVIGLAVTGIYLVFSRLRRQPRTTVAVGVASVLSMFLTPAGLHTASFYKSYFTTVAVQRGVGLSAPLSLTRPFDVLLIIAACLLVIRIRRNVPSIWQIACIVVLSAATIHSSRSGVWLLMFLAAPAACCFAPSRLWDGLIPALALASLVALTYAFVRGPLPSGASASIVDRALALSRGTPILADDIVDEQVALAGGRIWAGNPVEAFASRVQGIYLDWIEGRASGRAALAPEVRIVVTDLSSPAARLMSSTPGFVRVYADRTAAIYERTHVA